MVARSASVNETSSKSYSRLRILHREKSLRRGRKSYINWVSNEHKFIINPYLGQRVIIVSPQHPWDVLRVARVIGYLMVLARMAGWEAFWLGERNSEWFPRHCFLFLAGMSCYDVSLILRSELKDAFPSNLAGDSSYMMTLVNTRIDVFAASMLQLSLYCK